MGQARPRPTAINITSTISLGTNALGIIPIECREAAPMAGITKVGAARTNLEEAV